MAARCLDLAEVDAGKFIASNAQTYTAPRSDALGLRCVGLRLDQLSARSTVGRPDMQGFAGSLAGLGATKSVFVTTSTFSDSARDFVHHLSQRVILIDGQTFADLMIEHSVGVRTSQTLTLDEDFFAEDV